MKLTQNTILITGGSSGIGLALATAFAEKNNTVIICGRNPDKLAAVRQAHPVIHTLQCDISDDKAVTRMLARLETEFEPVNVLVNNAGTLFLYDFYQENNGLAKIEAEIKTNLVAPLRLTKLLLPQLSKHPEAAIINVSSGLAYAPMASAPVYCATKAALHSWTRSLRYQLRETSVKVFEVLPPTVDTPMTAAMDTIKISPEVLAQRTLKSLAHDTYEIRIGQSRVLYVISRLSPALTERILRKA